MVKKKRYYALLPLAPVMHNLNFVNFNCTKRHTLTFNRSNAVLIML